jgi:hypothetical protein
MSYLLNHFDAKDEPAIAILRIDSDGFGFNGESNEKCKGQSSQTET